MVGRLLGLRIISCSAGVLALVRVLHWRDLGQIEPFLADVGDALALGKFVHEVLRQPAFLFVHLATHLVRMLGVGRPRC